MEFNIDYGTLTPTARNPLDGPLFASIDGRVSSLATDEMVFLDPRTNATHVMTRQVLHALDLAREFRPLQQHAAHIAERLEGLKGKHQAVQRVLESLVKRGLLVSDADFLRRFESPAPSLLAPVAGVFIRACDRPAQVEALLASLLAYERRFAPGRRYVLIDDSLQGEAAREHARLLREFGAASACATVHVTRERWQTIAQTLERALPEHAVALRALLTREPGDATLRGGGIGRNLITLLAAGQRYVLLDDDFQFPLRRHPDYAPGLCADARGFGVRTFAARSAALSAGSEMASDPVAAHLAACGASLAEAMRGIEGCRLGRAELLGLAPSRARALRPESRISLTSNGHRGASGSASLSWLYMLAPAERAGLVDDRDAYLASHRDPAVWFGAARHSCGSGGQFTPFAIDNAAMMPCTSARGRGEDALYNALTQVFRRDAETLDFPFTIGHAPQGRRERELDAELPDANQCLAEFARHVAGDLHAERVETRVATFAARLDDLAAGSDRDLSAYLREYLAYRRSGTIERMQMAATADAAPALHWLADLRALVEANGKALIENGPPRFADWPGDADEAECVRRFRFDASELNAGLRAWPAAWEFALTQRWLD